MLVAHLSDPHVTTGALGAEPVAGLHRALGRVLGLQIRPDCVVITGDLTDRGTPDEYAVLHHLLKRFPIPVHLAVGNHDKVDAFLERDVPAIVCLHHPPMALGIVFLDGMRLDDGEELAAVVGRHRHVVRVLAGHDHRAITAGFAGTVLAVAPSTYRQSELGLREDTPWGYVAEPTGFLLHLLDDRQCVTHVVSVSHAGGLLGGY
jgi:Icc protein